MLGLQRLLFSDAYLEACFREHWAASSRTLLNLLSLLTLVMWAVATWNVHTHCKWSRFLCRTLEVICACGVAGHAYIQYQLRRHPSALLSWHTAYLPIHDSHCILSRLVIFILIKEFTNKFPVHCGSVVTLFHALRVELN